MFQLQAKNTDDTHKHNTNKTNKKDSNKNRFSVTNLFQNLLGNKQKLQRQIKGEQVSWLQDVEQYLHILILYFFKPHCRYFSNT